MFNMSALLLDDVLNPATPLTIGTISATLRRQFAHSQGLVTKFFMFFL